MKKYFHFLQLPNQIQANHKEKIASNNSLEFDFHNFKNLKRNLNI
jgi:hypothetical protein